MWSQTAKLRNRLCREMNFVIIHDAVSQDKDFSTSKGLVHHFWKWVSEWDQSKDIQVQRFYSWDTVILEVFLSVTVFPPSDFMIAI